MAIKLPMTLDQFRRTARLNLEADNERIEYLSGSAKILLIVGPDVGYSGYDPANGPFLLDTNRDSEQGFDLEHLEASLYVWAQREGLC